MVQATIRLPEKLYNLLKDMASEKGISMNAIVVSVLWDICLNDKK